MSYTPTVWESGDTITATRLNKIEQGIQDASTSGGGGAFYVDIEYVEDENGEDTGGGIK